MGKRCLMLWLLALSCLQVSVAGMQEANQYYIDGDYKNAITEYETLLKNGYESADLYYNLGNAYYRNGQIAPSILNYNRAHLLNPADKDIVANLKFVEAQTLDKIEVIGDLFLVSWWNAFKNLCTCDAWTYTSIACFILFLAAFIVYVFARKIGIKKAGFSVAVISLVLSVVSLIAAYQQYDTLTNRYEAIVFAPTITVKSSPSESGNDLFVLHEGTKVVIKSYVGEWAEVSTLDGHSGWLPLSTIEKI